MMLQLDGLKRGLKNFLFNTRRRNFQISDTALDMRGLEDNEIWFVDPVHPVNSVYTRIAEGVKRIAANYRCVGGSGGSGGGGGSGGRGQRQGEKRRWRCPERCGQVALREGIKGLW
jgi:hypothetical protein